MLPAFFSSLLVQAGAFALSLYSGFKNRRQFFWWLLALVAAALLINTLAILHIDRGAAIFSGPSSFLYAALYLVVSAGIFALVIQLRRSIPETDDAASDMLSQLSGILETSPIPFVVARLADTRIVYVNPAACRLFGATREQILGVDASRFFPDQDEFEQRVATVRQNDSYAHQDMTYMTFAGQPLYARSSGTKLTIDNEDHLLTSVIDVSTEKQAEMNLKESEEKFRALFYQSVVGIQTFSPEGRIEAVNPAFEKLWGVTFDQIRNYNILKDEQIRAIEGAEIDSLFAGEALVDFPTISYEMTIPGVPLKVTRTISPRAFSIKNERDEVMQIVVMHLDMTDQAQAEEQLKQAQKMEAFGQLTGGIAHDFNNLLAVILGNLDLASDRYRHEADLVRLLEPAIRASERGAELVQQLLAFSRRQPLQPRPIRLEENVLDMIGILQRTLGEYIEIETQFGDGDTECLADPAQLESALLNLAVNARHAMPEKGKLTIETAEVWLDEAYAAERAEVVAGPYVMLAVSDTGTGMSPTVLAQAFDPFFTTKGSSGTGLGLSMVYGFAKQSGGHVAIYSEQGHGTTVKLYLPRAAAEKEIASVATSENSVAIAGTRLLVVEDDSDVRELAKTLLVSMACHPTVTASGADALKALEQSGPFDLLLSDVVLAGGMSGVEVAREAKRRQPGIKVLFMSGYTENAVIHHGKLDAGVVLLQKPFRRADLARKLAEAMTKNDSDGNGAPR